MDLSDAMYETDVLAGRLVRLMAEGKYEEASKVRKQLAALQSEFRDPRDCLVDIWH